MSDMFDDHPCHRCGVVEAVEDLYTVTDNASGEFEGFICGECWEIVTSAPK